MRKEVSPVIVAIGIFLLLVGVNVVYWVSLQPEEGGMTLAGNTTPKGGGPSIPPTGLGAFQVTTLAGTSTPGYQDGPAQKARFNGPAAVAAAPDGALYIADSRNHAIRKLTPEGQVTTVAGAPDSNGYGGFADGPAAQARFSAPAGVAVLPDGGLLVADTGNHRLRKIAPDGAVSTIAGGDTLIDEMGRPAGGYQDGPAAQARFRYPVGVTVDKDGVIYIADAGNHCVRRLAHGLVSTLPVTGGEMKAPTMVLLAPDDMLWVSDSAGSALWTGPAQGPLTRWKGDAAESHLNAPAGLAVASAATFVLDAGTHCLYLKDGASMTLVVGQQGTAGYENGPGNTARFATPAGMTVRADGRLCIADFNNNCLREVTLPSREGSR